MRSILFYIILFSSVLSSCQKNGVTTPYEYALLSAHVYDDKDRKELPSHLNQFLDFDEENYKARLNIDLGKVINMVDNEDWSALIPYVGAKTLARGGYFGRAYVNKKMNHLIVAHRGTDLNIKMNELSLDQISIALDNGKIWDMIKDMDDDYDIFHGKIPLQQFEAAQHFVGEVKESYVEKYKKSPQIIHTGHSLGAVLAELCAVKDNSKAITFESPGSKPLALQLVDIQYIDIENVDITTYNAEPNQINTLHEHLGKVIPLYDKPKLQSAHSDTEKILSLKLHPIKELLKRFDEKNGEPKHP
ncbi:MAG: hypothetical protein P8M17_03105 [Saprospiraceae bacterium]|nr:hypothetical protein [Saprospiraceae bacterium]MDB4505591.1 hypothetical protein [Saprospiraceae bacterium]MDB4539468.1 hypothetical protein [Saprospiraceae bacterium]MDC3219661.1 hypothetical protein [Saprospiraceae bacterium]MDG1435382.1 hypothetical protein [Saprospiraceae bacterium]